MAEYEEKIISQLKGVGFKINPSSMLDHARYVMNENNHVIGYLTFLSGFCTIGDQHYSIAFDSVVGRSDCAGLFRSGIYAGSINL